MRDVSDHFAAALRQGYQLASFVEVWDPEGVVLANSDPDDDTVPTFDVVSGTISVDGSASIQRRVDDLTIVDASGDLVPDDATDFFSVVSSNELRIYTGMVVPELGVTELLLQGVFGLEGAQVEDSDGGLTITLSAYDRARTVSRAKTIVPQKIGPSNPPTTTAITQAQALVSAARTGTLGWTPQFKLVGGIDPGTQVNPTTGLYDKGGIPEAILNEGTDPWEAARKIIQDIGWEMFFDWDGQVLIRPVTDPNSTDLVPVWTYAEGVDSTLIRVSRGFSNEEAFNGQIVTGQNTSTTAVPRGQAWDDDPTSPTRRALYGSVPEFYQSELIRTDAQAEDVAKARLYQRRGANEQMEFEIVPNHAHEVGDVVTIQRARSKVDRTYIIDSFQLGLSATSGPMTITTRQRKA